MLVCVSDFQFLLLRQRLDRGSQSFLHQDHTSKRNGLCRTIPCSSHLRHNYIQPCCTRDYICHLQFYPFLQQRKRLGQCYLPEKGRCSRIQTVHIVHNGSLSLSYIQMLIQGHTCPCSNLHHHNHTLQYCKEYRDHKHHLQ